ncbi:MAG: hypothetical protein RL173_3617, partial [Fibrobacterota bacterium]
SSGAVRQVQEIVPRKALGQRTQYGQTSESRIEDPNHVFNVVTLCWLRGPQWVRNCDGS